MTEEKRNQNQEGYKVKTFPVPFSLDGIQENNNIVNLLNENKKDQIITQAFKSHLEGNIEEAIKYYQDFINQGFNDFRAFSNYGIIMRDHGYLKKAVIFLQKAIKLNPKSAESYYNLGLALKDLGKAKEAEISIHKSIELKPDFANAHFNLGTILKDLGKLKEAEISTLKAIELKPNFAEAYFNLGTILKDLGKLKEAEISTNKAIELKSDFANAHFNLGTILKDLGKLKEAEVSTLKAIELKADFAEAYFNLGLILIDLGKLKEAEISTRKAIKLKPDFAEAYLNLGNILNNLGKLKGAEIFTRKATELKPNYVEAYLNLGNTLNNLGKLKEAEISTRKAIKLKPDFAEAYLNLGNTLRDLGKLQEALQAYQKSFDIEPKEIHRISNLFSIFSKLCLWERIEHYYPYLNIIGIEGKAISPLDLMYLEDNPINHLKRAIKFSKVNIKESLAKINYKKNDIIKIGYFSSDFRNHPVSHLITRVLELHDKKEFKIYAYSLHNIEDDYTNRIKNAVFLFRNLKDISDLEIVNIVREDNIDIAVDLNGYTKNNRTSIFSYRLAPIQINYLGYPGTLGSKSFDYIFADKILIPENYKKFYVEKVMYLPNSFIPHDNTKKISRNKFSKEMMGLPSEGFIFTCFNNIQKITLKEFHIWMNLLKKVDNSVLWIMKPHKSAIENINYQLKKHGLTKGRVIYAEKMNLDDHLSRHSCGDLFLDTFNYNAGTTATDALWAGMPLITLLGKSYSARMGGSILSACDLHELITQSVSEYECLAYELATNKDKLIRIKRKVKDKINSSFFDTNNFTRGLEKVYAHIADLHFI